MPYGWPMHPDQLAVQLYTLRALLAQDVPGTLTAVATAGYRSVELAGLPPMSARTLRDRLDEAGLQPVGAHVPLEELRADLPGQLERAKIVGYPRIIVPWLPEAERETADGARRLAAELGRIAAACDAEGIALGYHNHAFEFAPLDETTIWQVLLETLPATVELELDVYWASVGGQDPADLIRASGDRIRLLHMKDRAAGPEGRDVTPGDGVLDWQAIVDAARAAGVAWYVVEEDNPVEALAEIERGRRYLEGLARRSGAA